jgi:hypothetical protein
MTLWTIAGAALLAVAAYLLFSGFFRTLVTYRGTRVITCPENGYAAAVKVDALHAAHWDAISGAPDLHLRSCSRWPEKAGCGQECLAQIETSPEACLVTTIVKDWYRGKDCAICEREIGDIVWHERPAAVRVGGLTREWKDVAPEELPGVFATGEPVCWTCHVRESFLRENPRMVVERPRPAEPAHRAIEPTRAVY